MAVDGAPACAPLCFTYEGCSRGQTGVGNKKMLCLQVNRVEREVANCLFGRGVWATRVLTWLGLKIWWDVALTAPVKLFLGLYFVIRKKSLNYSYYI